MYVMFYDRVKGSFGWTKPNNGIYITQHNQQTCAWRATLESCDTRTIKGRINLFIELDVKLDQIAARNIRISLDKRTATALQRKTYEGKYTRDKILPTVLPNSSNHSRAWRHNKECKYWSNTFTVNVILIFFSCLHRGDQSTVFCIVSWDTSSKLNAPKP